MPKTLALSYHCLTKPFKIYCNIFLQGMNQCSARKFKVDNVTSMLAAEYSFWILCVSCLHKLNPTPEEVRVERICEEMHSNQYTKLFEEMIKKMKHALNEASRDDIKPIKESNFINVVENYQQVAKNAFSAWKCMRHKFPNQVKTKAAAFWPMFLKLCVFLSSDELVNYLDDIDELMDEEGAQHLKNAIEKPECTKWFTNRRYRALVLNELETYQVVDNLINPIKRDSNGTIKGAMNVVKVTKNKYGNELYRTLCIARKIACHDRDFQFEIVRHYGSHSLVDINTQDRQSASGRILRQIQQEYCQNRYDIFYFNLKPKCSFLELILCTSVYHRIYFCINILQK